jgi:hypothetical protein
VPFRLGKSFTLEDQVQFNNPFNPTGAAIFVNSHGNSAFSKWGFGLVALDHRGVSHVGSSIPKQIMANNTDTLSAC